MSDHTKKDAPRPEETDWGRKLKEYMEQSMEQIDRPEDTDVASEPDELELLLRAQLSVRPEATPGIAPEEEVPEEKVPEEEVSEKEVSEEEDFEEEIPEEEDFEEEVPEEEVSEEEVLEEEVPEEEVPEEEVSEEEVSEEEVPEEEILEEEVPEEEVPEEEIPEEEVLEEEVPEEEVSEEEVPEEEVPEEEVPEEEVPEEEVSEVTGITDPGDAPLEDDTPEKHEMPPENVPETPAAGIIAPEATTDEDADTDDIRPAPDAAPDDSLNGWPVSSLLTSTAFLDGLDDTTRNRVLNVLTDKDAPIAKDDASTPGSDDTVLSGKDDAIADVAAEAAADVAAAPDVAEEALSPEHSVRSAHTERTRGAARPIYRASRGTERINDPMQISLDDLPDSSNTSDILKRRNSAPAEAGRSQTAVPVGTADADPDAALLLHLGYGDRLNAAVGASGAGQADSERPNRERVGTRNACPPAFRNREYTGRAMNEGVEKRYKTTFRMDILRLAVAVMGMLAGMVYDSLPILGNSSPDVMTFTHSPLYPLFGLCMLLIFALPCLPRLLLGLRSLWDFEPVRYAVPAMGLVINLCNCALACFTTGRATTPPALFCEGTLGILCATITCDLLATLAQWRSFRMVSSGRPFYVVTKEAPAAGDGTNAEENGDTTLSVRRTRRLPDFFTWADRYQRRLGHLNYLLPAALLLSLLAGGLTVIWGGQLTTDCPRVCTATYLCCLPACFLLSLTLPWPLANKDLTGHGGAVIGEATPDVYIPRGHAGKRTKIRVPDGVALHAVSPTVITVKGDRQAALWMALAGKLFALMDCPLYDAEAPVSRQELDAIKVELAESGHRYVRLYMTDLRRRQTVEVMAGTHAALTQRGVTLPPEKREKSFCKTEDTQVLYLAFDRHFRLACAAEYQMDEAFATAVRRLAAQGSQVSLMTYDPLVSSAVLKTKTGDTPPVRLIRPRQYTQLYALRSSGLISSGKGADVLRPYFACIRMKKAYTAGTVLTWISLLLAPPLYLLAARMGWPAGRFPAVVTLWQTLFVLLSVLLTHLIMKPASENTPPRP